MKKEQHLIFDLDGTLVQSSAASAYLSTNPGREYAVTNINAIHTELYDPNAPKLIKSLLKYFEVSIVTDSPRSYAKALLDKHGFPELRLIASAKKPDTSGLEEAISDSGIPKKSTLIIGDSPRDILAAHGLSIKSLAVTSNTFYIEEKLKQAEPTLICEPNTILTAIGKFLDNDSPYCARKIIRIYHKLEHEYYFDPRPEINHTFLGEYHPFRNGNMDSHSKKILTFKGMKDVKPCEINNGERRKYFAGGMLRTEYEPYIDIFTRFKDACIKKIEEMKLDGCILILSAPNSLPEFCYKCDVNHALTKAIAKEVGISTPKRFISRIEPKLEAHNGNRGGHLEHYMTIGTLLDQIPGGVDHIVIIDDVMTSGTQVESVAHILSSIGLEAKYHSLVLGKTTDHADAFDLFR